MVPAASVIVDSASPLRVLADTFWVPGETGR